VLGTIVCSIDDDSYSEAFPREHWAFKERGVVVRADDGRVFHYDDADEDFELLRRAESERLRSEG